MLHKTHGIFLRILFLSSFAVAAIAQNAVMLPWTPQQFTNTNGTILVSGKVCTYLGGTSTGTATFTDSTAGTSNAIPPNAILLDSTGRPTSGGIWLTPNKAYKIVTMTAGSDNTCSTGVVIKTQDNVLANNGFTVSFPETAPPGSLAATGFDVCYGDTALHGIKCNYNNAGFSSLPLVGFVNTWTANQLFGSGNLLPSVAGGTDLGSASLPFGNLWLGTAATNNFKFAPAATAAARTITIPDPLGNDTLTFLAATQTLTNKTLNVPLPSGTGLQIFNTTTTCTTGASVGATCTTANISLPVAEADANYRVTCTGKGLTNVPVVIATTNASASQFTITAAALTAAAASFTSYDCIAGHN